MPGKVAGPVDWVRSMLVSWLDREDRDLAQLARWLRGLDLPPVGPAEEPYVWFLRSLPLGAQRPRYERGLAQSAAALLQAAPEVNEPESERLLYNLLMLSAGLRGRDELRDALVRLFEEGSLDGRSYDITELNHALRSALVMNQSDARLLPVWDGMIQGHRHARLGGSIHDGFEGVLNMPASAEERGKPAVAAIGRGLTALCSSLTRRAGVRVPLFRSFLDEVCQRYPAYNWEIQMVHFSNDHLWPDWTDVALPNLMIRLGDRQFVLWAPAVEVLQHSCEIEIRVQRRFCAARILQVEAPDLSLEHLVLAAGTLEKYRRSCSYGGESAVSGLLSSAFTEMVHRGSKVPSEMKKAATDVHQVRVMASLAAG